jgi:L-threonylcarbamoyladenylate synthase
MPSNKVALELIKKVGVMVGPSANLSGDASLVTYQEVLANLGDNTLEAIIAADHNNLIGVASTILDLTNSANPQILRLGTVTQAMLAHFWK